MAGDPHHKASVAAGRGAAGIIILLEEGRPLPEPTAEERPPVKIPAAAVAGALAQGFREAAQEEREAELSTALEPRMLEARNVVALIPGTDPTLSREVMRKR